MAGAGQLATGVWGADGVAGAQESERLTARCLQCGLVQFVSTRNQCKRCQGVLLETIDEVKDAVRDLKEKREPERRPEVGGPVFSPSRLVALRRARRLSQGSLARRMGVPRTYVSKVENGHAVPTIESLLRFAAGLDCHSAELLVGLDGQRMTDTRALLADPLLKVIAAELPNLSWSHRIVILDQVKRLAKSHMVAA